MYVCIYDRIFKVSAIMKVKESEGDVVFTYFLPLVAFFCDGSAQETSAFLNGFLSLSPNPAFVTLGPMVNVIVFSIVCHLFHLGVFSNLF